MLHLVIVLIVIGVLLWAINAYLPMDAKIKQILNIVVVICVVVFLLNEFGVLSGFNDIPVPRVESGTILLT